MRSFSLFLCVVLASLFLYSSAVVHACLNDRDTAGEEARAMPDVYRASIGWFDRYPPLYYQMRIARVAKDLAANPTLLNEYDDIAVAYDRIGQDDQAIAWIQKKKAHLPPLAGATPDMREQWYRYHANYGTFLVHRWVGAGADRKKIGQVKAARNEIIQALAINPNAHFGREKFQLMVMDWMINPYKPVSPEISANPNIDSAVRKFIIQSENGQSEFTPLWSLFHAPPGGNMPAEAGLSGLVELGGAWESPDVFAALCRVCGMRERMATFSYYRCEELLAEGKKPLCGTPDQTVPPRYFHSMEGDYQLFKALRKQADEYQARRTAFMMARLTAGRHPDTDPTFWNGWHDEEMPIPAIPLNREIYLLIGKRLGFDSEMNFEGFALIWGLIALVVALNLVRLWRERKRRRSVQAIAKQTAAPKPPTAMS